MSNYADADILASIYQDLLTYVDVDNVDGYITMAHGWVIDSCRPFFHPPTDNPSQLLILAEANYALYLILRSADEEIKSLAFQQEAWRLIRHIESSADTQDSTYGGPASSASNVEPVFSKGKYNTSGSFLGNKMGIQDDNRGSLDDW